MGELSGAQALIGLLVLIAGPGGAAWVAVRVSLNGARQDIRDIKTSVGQLTDKQGTTAIEVARLDERVSSLEDRAA